jgi:hypothetical protein
VAGSEETAMPVPIPIPFDLALAAPVALHAGLIGSAAFTALLFALHLAGPEHAVRDADGRFAPGASRWARAAAAAAAALLLAVPVAAAAGYVRAGGGAGFAGAAATAYLAFLVVNLYDLVVVDGLLVLGLGRRLGALPATPYFTTWRPHLVGFARGLAFGVVPSLAAATVAVVAF